MGKICTLKEKSRRSDARRDSRDEKRVMQFLPAFGCSSRKASSLSIDHSQKQKPFVDWVETSEKLPAERNCDYYQTLSFFHIDRTWPLSGSFHTIIASLNQGVSPMNEGEFYHSTHPFSSIVV